MSVVSQLSMLAPWNTLASVRWSIFLRMTATLVVLACECESTMTGGTDAYPGRRDTADTSYLGVIYPPSTSFTATGPVSIWTGGPDLSGVQSPLQTVFTPPPTCLSKPWTSYTSTLGLLTCTQDVVSEDPCFPSGFFDVNAQGYYSPGVCPSGYSAARSYHDETTVTSIHYGTFSRRDGATPRQLAARALTTSATATVTLTSTGSAWSSLCCPTGMALISLPSSTYSCATLFTQPQVVIFGNAVATYTQPFSALAPAIAVVWAIADLPFFTPASAPLRSALVTSTPGSLNTSTSGSSNGSAPAALTTGTAQLSSGAAAGIGVAATVFGLFLLGAGAWVLWRRRNRKIPAEEVTFLSDSEKKTELSGESRALHEMDGNIKAQEMGYQEHRAELATIEPQELPTDWHGFEAPQARGDRKSGVVTK